MSNEKGAGKVINMIKCVGGGRWNDGLCNVLLRRKEGEIVPQKSTPYVLIKLRCITRRVDYFLRNHI